MSLCLSRLLNRHVSRVVLASRLQCAVWQSGRAEPAAAESCLTVVPFASHHSVRSFGRIMFSPPYSFSPPSFWTFPSKFTLPHPQLSKMHSVRASLHSTFSIQQLLPSNSHLCPIPLSLYFPPSIQFLGHFLSYPVYLSSLQCLSVSDVL